MTTDTSADVAAEIAGEQAHVDRVYSELEKASARASEVERDGIARGRSSRSGEVRDEELTGLFERDALVYAAAKRRSAIEKQYEGLVFGRLDLGDVETPAAERDSSCSPPPSRRRPKRCSATGGRKMTTGRRNGSSRTITLADLQVMRPQADCPLESSADDSMLMYGFEGCTHFRFEGIRRCEIPCQRLRRRLRHSSSTHEDQGALTPRSAIQMAQQTQVLQT